MPQDFNYGPMQTSVPATGLKGFERYGLPTSPTDISLTILQFAPIVLLSAVHHLTSLLDRRPELF